MAKITFTMNVPQPKKHSTRFDFDAFVEAPEGWSPEEKKRFAPSFYIPKPFAEGAKAIHVTIEEIE